MTDERNDQPEPTTTDHPRTNPQPSGARPAEKPRPSVFETEWDDAPTTNTFRIPRS